MSLVRRDDSSRGTRRTVGLWTRFKRMARAARVSGIVTGLAALAIAAPLLAAPADVFESPGAIAEGKAPDTLSIDAGDGSVPSLALRYSSQQPLSGGVAAGWSLSIPTISQDYSTGLGASAPVFS